jgi:hypothetical protein
MNMKDMKMLANTYVFGSYFFGIQKASAQEEIKTELVILLNSRAKVKDLSDYIQAKCAQTVLDNYNVSMRIFEVCKIHFAAAKSYEEAIEEINEIFLDQQLVYHRIKIWKNELLNNPIEIRINSYGGVPDESEILKCQLLKLQAKYFKS